MSIRIARTLVASSSRLAPRPSLAQPRFYSAPSEPITEDLIKAKLQEALSPSQIRVQDTSGGCGSFFNIDIVSKAFNGLSKVKQQRLVNDVLKREVGGMHGLSMRTVPEDEKA